MKALLAAVTAICMLLAAPSAQAIDVTWKDHAKTESLAQDAGHYVLLHFWASWCPPCRNEMPELAAWVKAHPDIVFVPISLDDRPADAARFLKANKLGNVPVLMGSAKEVTAIGIRAIPTTMIIGPRGHVLRTIHGASPWGTDTFSRSVLATMQRGHGGKD